MRRQILVLALAVVVIGWGLPASAQPSDTTVSDSGCTCGGDTCCDSECGSNECCGCNCDCDPLLTFRADALFLHRSTPRSAVLVTDSYTPGGTVLLDANQFDFDTQTGWDIYLARDRVFGDWGIEANYFSVDGWNASTEPVTSPGGAVVQFVTPLGNTQVPATLSASYASQLYSVEINARRPLLDWLTLLLGYRFLELDESGLSIAQDVGPGLNLATYSIKSQNSLSGFQVGLDSQIPVGQRLTLQGIGKVGIYGNRASNNIYIYQSDSPETFGSETMLGHTAFVGELDFAATYAVTDQLSVRGGYQLLWLEGVALASNQVAVSDPDHGISGIHSTGGVFYNGAFVGLEYRR
jgi:hypothetical protein